MSTVPTNAFSASFVRNIVKNGLKDKFDDIYNPYFDEDDNHTSNKLYTSIQNGLSHQEIQPVSKKRKRMISGGRRTRQRKTMKTMKTIKTRKNKNKRKTRKNI
jgi:hypothetical protein